MHGGNLPDSHLRYTAADEDALDLRENLCRSPHEARALDLSFLWATTVLTAAFIMILLLCLA